MNTKGLIEDLKIEQSKHNPSKAIGEIAHMAFEVAIRLVYKHEQQVKSVGLDDVVGSEERAELPPLEKCKKCKIYFDFGVCPICKTVQGN